MLSVVVAGKSDSEVAISTASSAGVGVAGLSLSERAFRLALLFL